MNILVIGNGFDLAHGLETTYKDFLKFANFFNFNKRLQKLNSYDNEKASSIEYFMDFLNKGYTNEDVLKILDELDRKSVV